MNLCGSCKHYVSDKDPRTGTCGRIHVEWDPEHGLYNDKASVEDGSFYHAALLCRSDFGCVLHEEQTNA